MTLEFKPFKRGEQEPEHNAVCVVKCPEWNEEGYAVATYHKEEGYFLSDHPNYDRFTRYITHYAKMEEK